MVQFAASFCSLCELKYVYTAINLSLVTYNLLLLVERFIVSNLVLSLCWYRKINKSKEIKITLTSRYYVFIRKLSHDDFTWDDFLQPFSTGLWLTVCISVLVLSFLLSALHNLGRRYGNAEADGPSRFSLYDSLHCVFGIFCQQGKRVAPNIFHTPEEFQLLINQTNSAYISCEESCHSYPEHSHSD